MPVRERQIVDVVHVDVHAPRRDLVQQRLPNMRLEMIDERDFGTTLAAQLVAESARER